MYRYVPNRILATFSILSIDMKKRKPNQGQINDSWTRIQIDKLCVFGLPEIS